MATTTTAGFVYDPSTPEFQERIWDVYRTMRDHHPVYQDPAGGFYALSRFEDVWAAVNDHRGFSSTVAEANDLLPQMIYMDPPRHTALRALVSRAFTPKRVAAVEEGVRACARSLLDEIAQRGECEIQHEYAAVIPSVVISRLIGIDEHYVEPMRTWTQKFVGIQKTGDFGEAAERIYAMFAELLAERRRQPRDDMMTALIEAEVDGKRLSDEELLGFCMLLILGGNDTTSSLIGSGTVILARHPDQREALIRDPSLWSNAVEEMNRLESPTQVLPRTTTKEFERHGERLPAGSRVMLIWGSANHDEREFPDPERFDVNRKFGRYLAFGHGAHYCLGANLARLEARVAFEEWHARFPRYELAAEPERVTSIWARAFHRVPVRIV